MAAGGASAAYDCDAGCPLAASAPVCGSNGVTFGNGCLAECSGVPIAYLGLCEAPDVARRASVSAAAAAGDTAHVHARAATRARARGADPARAFAEHPIGQFLDAGGSAAPAAAAVAGGDGAMSAAAAAAAAGPRMVTAADIKRFSAEGLSLVGAPRLGAFKIAKRPASDNAGYFSDRALRNRRMELYTVRVVPDLGLVYASAPEVAFLGARGAAAASAPVPPAAAVPPQPAAPEALAAFLASADAPTADGGLDGAASSNETADGGSIAGSDGSGGETLSGATVAESRRLRAGAAGAAAAAAAPYRKIAPSDWLQISSNTRALPNTAVGLLEVRMGTFEASCTGTLIGDHAVLTAGHCVYDKGSSTGASGFTFSPHHYYDSKGNAVKPFGSSEAVSYDYMAGRTADGALRAYVSDMAVVYLKKPLGQVAGTIGLAYERAGYKGQLSAAGYPGLTVTVGRFFRLAGPCVVKDTNGDDRMLRFKSATQSGCFSRCAIAENGQSGQAAYSVDNSGRAFARAVLSMGPPPGTCRGFDTYTEIDAKHFAWLQGRRTYVPPSAGRWG